MMFKKLVKSALSLTLVLCLVLSLTVPVSAAPGEAQFLDTVIEGGELTFILSYDKEFPEVVLTDPDGNTQVVNEGNTALELALYDGWAAVRVKSPKAGDWHIAVDQKSNTEVTWNIVESMESIWIQYIRVTPNTDGTVQVSFLADYGSQESSYEYELLLATNEGNGTVSVGTGGATTGREETRNLDLRGYNSYEAYVMRLRVTMEVDGYTLFDEYSSEPFAYSNPATPEAPGGIDLFVDAQSRELELDWKNYKEYRFDSYYLEVLTEGTDEPVYFGEFAKEDERFSIYVDSGLDNLTVQFYGREGKLLSAPLVRQVTLGDKSCLQILTESPTSSNQVQIRMNLPDTVPMQVTVGETVSTFVSTGVENTVAVGIQNGSNLVIAEAVVDGTTYRVEKRIYKDGFPPMLSFFEPYDGMTFQTSRVTLVGNVDSAAKLLLNGNPVEVDEYGDFSVVVSLEPGENIAEFIAEDAVGNRTNRTIYLYSPQSQGGSGAMVNSGEFSLRAILPLLISLVLSASVIVAAVVLLKRRENLKKYSYAALVWILVLLLCGTACGLVSAVMEKNALEKTASSMELSDMVDHSVTDAVQLVQELQKAPDRVMTWTLLTVVMAVLLVAVIVYPIWRKRRGNGDEHPPTQMPMPEEPPRKPELTGKE